ncbi:MAG: GDP-mannose 4,6-dehydratase [Planctomycetaceae bacterium]|nr:GDP-mannose 4,6-dehydratase [Planctomycetaceae bacterium]
MSATTGAHGPELRVSGDGATSSARKKRALITGITGQDGAYLAEFLLSKGYEVYGLYRRLSSANFWRLRALGVFERVHLLPGDMTDIASISNAILNSQPDEIYNLAAQSFVGTSFEQPLITAQIDGVGVLMLLEAVKQLDRSIRVYHASTSEMYGATLAEGDAALNEESLFWPASPYAVSKLFSYHQLRVYREAYDMFLVNGILFNHESPLRGLDFVTRKISNAVARIKLGLDETIQLGNITAMRDWGYAPEYVEAMWLMLQQDQPDDFVIATGESHSVRDFLTAACGHLGLDWQEVLVESEKLMRPLDVPCLLGDTTKASTQLGWEPRVKFAELVKIMVETDLNRWNDYLNGVVVPWDAPNCVPSSQFQHKRAA